MAIVKQLDKRSGITYLYESVSRWDKARRQSRATRRLIGRLAPETGETRPTDGRMRKARERAAGPAPGESPPVRLFAGATWLLDRICDQIGLGEDLRRVFPQSWREILSIAQFMALSDGMPLYRFGKWGFLPFYYRKTAGNVPDVKTVRGLVRDLDSLGFGHVRVTTDRDYYSEANLDELFASHHKFLVGVSTSPGFVKKAIAELSPKFNGFGNYDLGAGANGATTRIAWTVHRKRPRKGDELLDRLDVIEVFRRPGERERWGEILEKQKEIYRRLGVKPPPTLCVRGRAGFSDFWRRTPRPYGLGPGVPVEFSMRTERPRSGIYGMAAAL